MPAQTFQIPDNATIEVELEVAGSTRKILGKGFFQVSDPDLGPTLRVVVSDPAGDFELLLPESAIADRILRSESPDCDFTIRLAGA